MCRGAADGPGRSAASRPRAGPGRPGEWRAWRAWRALHDGAVVRLLPPPAAPPAPPAPPVPTLALSPRVARVAQAVAAPRCRGSAVPRPPSGPGHYRRSQSRGFDPVIQRREKNGSVRGGGGVDKQRPVVTSTSGLFAKERGAPCRDATHRDAPRRTPRARPQLPHRGAPRRAYVAQGPTV